MTIDLERLAVDADYWDEVAPEGATHFMYSEKFVKWVDGVEWAFYTSSDKAWKQATLTWPLQKYTDNGNEVVAKPKSHPTDTQPTESGAQISSEWDGNIPPVGWHGECTWGRKCEWSECVILPVGKIAKQEFNGWFVRVIDDYRAIEFRPIRSQAEQEREDLAKVLVECHDTTINSVISGSDEIKALRFAAAKPKWAGGFPPVGTKCKMANTRGKWLLVKIIDCSDGYCFGWNLEETTMLYSNDVTDFSPIRSQAERDREDLAELLGNCVKMRTTFGEMADVIIAAGWCKEGL
jgi:hypothetical protein